MVHLTGLMKILELKIVGMISLGISAITSKGDDRENVKK
jgi:hypothetical protein